MVDRLFGSTPAQDPFAPGPFALADAARVERVLQAAGYGEVALEPHDVQLRLGSDAREAALTVAGFGIVARRLASLAQADRPAVMTAIGTELERWQTPDGIALGAGTWLVSARPARG